MHYVKQFDINGVATKQVACIELHGKPNAATEGCVGVLGIDMDSPTHDVYKCSAVNGSIYTWELLSSGLSIMSASISGGGTTFAEFPYADLRKPTTYVVKIGDLIIDSEGYLYQISALSSTYCVASYCTRVVAYGMSAYDLAVKEGFEGSEGEWLLSLQGKGLSVKANKSSCTELGDGYIDTNGDLQILTTLPSTFTNCGQIRGPAGESISVSWSIAYYGVSNSASTRPTSWSSSIPTNIAEGQYLWTRTDIRFSDGATASGYTYSKQGAKGDKGDSGTNGTSVTITNISESTVSGGTNTVTFSDGNKLNIKNGKDGKDGADGTNGKDGTSVTITDITESTEDGDSNVVTFSDGKTLAVKNGNRGLSILSVTLAPTPNGDDGVLYTLPIATIKTEAGVNEVLVGDTILHEGWIYHVYNLDDIYAHLEKRWSLNSGSSTEGDVIGTLDENNNVILSGDLADGTYTLKYENADGTYTELGTLQVGELSVVSISATKTKTSYTAGDTLNTNDITVTATYSDGSTKTVTDYDVNSSAVTMGTAGTYNLVVSFGGASANISITVVAAGSTYENLCVVGGDGWISNGRCSSGGADRPDSEGAYVTNYIAVKQGDVVRVKNFEISTGGSRYSGIYKADKTAIKGFYMNADYADCVTIINKVPDSFECSFTIAHSEAGYIRLCGTIGGSASTSDIIVTVNQEIV